jgi:hypothetical protein
VTIDDQGSFRQVLQRLGRRPGRQKGIKGHQGKACRMEEQDHHQGGREGGALHLGLESTDAAHNQGTRCEGERPAQVDERPKRQVLYLKPIDVIRGHDVTKMSDGSIRHRKRGGPAEIPIETSSH